MILKLFLLQIIAHLVSDFLFQPQSWSEKKTHGYFTLHHFYHILIVGIFTYLVLTGSRILVICSCIDHFTLNDRHSEEFSSNEISGQQGPVFLYGSAYSLDFNRYSGCGL